MQENGLPLDFETTFRIGNQPFLRQCTSPLHFPSASTHQRITHPSIHFRLVIIPAYGKDCRVLSLTTLRSFSLGNCSKLLNRSHNTKAQRKPLMFKIQTFQHLLRATSTTELFSNGVMAFHLPTLLAQTMFALLRATRFCGHFLFLPMSSAACVSNICSSKQARSLRRVFRSVQLLLFAGRSLTVEHFPFRMMTLGITRAWLAVSRTAQSSLQLRSHGIMRTLPTPRHNLLCRVFT